MKNIISTSAQFASGVAAGTAIYYLVTNGPTADTWYRSAFTFVALFVVGICWLRFRRAFWPQKA
jgi:hypothetical protein